MKKSPNNKKLRASKKRQESERVRLTSMQRLLIKGLQEGKSVLQAALAAGYAPSTAKSNVYRSSAVRSAIAQLMDGQGLGDEVLLKKLSEKLEASHQQKKLTIPLHDIQLKALDMALKLKGLYPAAKMEVTKRDFGSLTDGELDDAIRSGQLGESD